MIPIKDISYLFCSFFPFFFFFFVEIILIYSKRNENEMIIFVCSGFMAYQPLKVI